MLTFTIKSLVIVVNYLFAQLTFDLNVRIQIEMLKIQG